MCKYLSGYSMPQIYDQLGYIPNILAIILLKTPYFDPKKITRASFLFALAKFVLSVHLSVDSLGLSVGTVCSSVPFYCAVLFVFPRGTIMYI
jgi:hypothetical protein